MSLIPILPTGKRAALGKADPLEALDRVLVIVGGGRPRLDKLAEIEATIAEWHDAVGALYDRDETTYVVTDPAKVLV